MFLFIPFRFLVVPFKDHDFVSTSTSAY